MSNFFILSLYGTPIQLFYKYKIKVLDGLFYKDYSQEMSQFDAWNCWNNRVATTSENLERSVVTARAKDHST